METEKHIPFGIWIEYLNPGILTRTWSCSNCGGLFALRETYRPTACPNCGVKFDHLSVNGETEAI